MYDEYLVFTRTGYRIFIILLWIYYTNVGNFKIYFIIIIIILLWGHSIYEYHKRRRHGTIFFFSFLYLAFFVAKILLCTKAPICIIGSKGKTFTIMVRSCCSAEGEPRLFGFFAVPHIDAIL